MDEDGRDYPPGTQQPTRFRPRFHYELFGCGLHGHELVGTAAAQIRPEDGLFVRERDDGLRWYRCVRCDAWLPLPQPLPPPAAPTQQRLSDCTHFQLPLRGRPLRDRYILRLIALDRIVHFLVLGVLAAAVFLFAADREALSRTFY